MKILSKKINNISVAAFLVAISSLISRLLGMLRDRILAGTFGAGDDLDVYYAAFRVPDLIFNLFVLGAISAGFIPIFTRLLSDKDQNNYKDAWALVRDLLNTLILVLGVFSLLGFIFAGPLTKIISPGFSLEKQAIVASLTRIMFLSPILLGMSSIFSGVLQSFRYFLVYSIAPILYNVGIIFGALFLKTKDGVHGLAWGVVLGAFLHMLIQLPVILKLGFRYSFKINFRSQDLRRIGKIMVPRTLSLGVSQINLLVMTIIASTLATGSLTIYNLANNLQFFPVGIFGISFSIAAFPTFARLADNNIELVKSFSKIFRKILFFIIPSTVFMLVFRSQIVRVVLGAGKFDWNDTIMTINVLSFFVLSLFAQATIPLLVRIFYVKQNTKTPFYIALVSTAVAIILSLYLPGLSFSGGVSGLAFAFSISMFVNFFLIWIFLKREMGNLDEFRIIKTATKIIVASLLAGFVAQMLKTWLGTILVLDTFLEILLQGFVAGVIGLLIYVIICYILKIEELNDFVLFIKRNIFYKFRKSNNQL